MVGVQINMKLVFLILFFPFLTVSAQVAIPAKPTQERPGSTSAGQPAITDKDVIIPSGSWKKQTETRPSDASAWLNYYQSLERNREISETEKKNQQAKIVSNSEKYIASSWQMALIRFMQSDRRDSSSLFSALRLSPEKEAIYPYAVQYAIINNDPSMLWLYCKALNEARPMTPGLYEYHYNTLMSAGSNATLYARGLNDLVPVAIIQQVYGIRRDVLLKYYEGKVDGDAGDYLFLSLGKEVIGQFPNSVFSGLLVKLDVDEEPVVLKDVMEQFSLSFLENAVALPEDEQMVFRNYLPSFIVYYKQLKKSNDPEAELWKSRIMKLGSLTGTAETVKKLIGQH